MSLSNLLRYNAIVFETLKSKCERETKFGKLANFVLYVLFRSIRALKAVRQKKQVLRRITKLWRRDADGNVQSPSAPWHFPLSQAALELSIGRHILIVAELSIPQCKRYRVDQKAAALRALGWNVEVVSFTDEHSCLKSLPFSSLVIFYRTPYWPPVKRLIDECKRLGIPSLFDIDDLVFSVEEYRKHPKLQDMKKAERDSFLRGAEFYRECLSACDHAIASTQTLAEWMQKYVKGRIFVIENAFDALSIQVMEFASSRPARQRKTVIIGYGSGTKSHDHDFQLASPALLRILNDFPEVSLIIHGYLNLDPEFDRHAARITRIPFLPAEAYLQSVADFDINLAPLESSVFNDAKSNIKFIEAALVGVPTVASSSVTMARIIDHGRNGFLATTENEWYDCLRQLVKSPQLRSDIGIEAKTRAWQHYRPESTQDRMREVVQAVLPVPVARSSERLKPRVLAVNIFYKPFSFGGATVLLENVMSHLQDHADLAVFTCNQLPELPEYAVFKYEVGKCLIYSCKVEGLTLEKSEIHHPGMMIPFEQVLQQFRPDVVHFHAIQGMGIGLLETACKFGSRVVVTAHDAWWICARQFMMKEDKSWCGQTQIDLRVCAACTGRPENTYSRSLVMNQALENADVVLSPSVYHQNLLRNNLPKSTPVLVNKNGVEHPQGGRLRPAKAGSDVIRFAFIGGLDADHKGYDLVVGAFRSVKAKNFELILVDLHQKLGRPATYGMEHEFADNVKVVPPFDHSRSAEFYSSIDVLIAPSRIPESFGLAAREAVLNGCHVIVSRMGGVEEDLQGVSTAHFLEFVDLKHLLAVIESMLTQGLKPLDPSSIPNIASPAKQAEELLDIYKRLLP